MSRITVFEGPDGSGKSTLAKRYAEITGACYRHHGPCSCVTGNHLLKVYVEMMLPALLGYQDVVLDRAWLSEQAYGSVIRSWDRVGYAGARLVERLALRCEVAVVLCLPSLEVCRRVWGERGAGGDLYSQELMAKVYRGYETRWQDGDLTDLPLVTHTVHGYEDALWRELAAIHEHQEAHPVAWRTGGNLLAPVALVGDASGLLRNEDLELRVPFGSFNAAGCSRWLATQLGERGIKELDLFWVNSGDPAFEEIAEEWLVGSGKAVHALGAKASERLGEVGIDHVRVNHPQYAKRFRHRQVYELPRLIREALDDA